MTANKLLSGFILTLVPFGISAVTTQATQTIDVTVSTINELSVTDGTGTMTINSGTAGASAMTPVTDANSRLYITTNDSSKKVTAQTDIDLTGPTLKVSLSGGTISAQSGTLLSDVDLTNSYTSGAVDVITGVTKATMDAIVLTYELAANFSGGTVSTKTVTVTYTLTDT